MFRNRISGYFPDAQPEEEPRTPPGFTAVPISQLPPDAQFAAQHYRSLYQLAFAQARAACEASPLD